MQLPQLALTSLTTELTPACLFHRTLSNAAEAKVFGNESRRPQILQPQPMTFLRSCALVFES